MKKNKMMRLASSLMVAVLLTTSMISGTFAKYVTEADASDAARVAKWGVTVVASGSLYGEKYAAATSKITASEEADVVSVWGKQATAPTTNKVVAPGTESDAGFSFAINGKPEVDSEIKVSLTHENIFLAEGKYGVMVKVDGITEENFVANKYYTKSGNDYTLAAAHAAELYELHDAATVAAGGYWPVVYSLTGDTSITGDTTADSLKVVADKIMGQIAGTASTQDSACDSKYTFTDVVKNIENNTDLATTLKLGAEKISWAWKFEGINDEADTILGNLMAERINTDDFKGDVVKAAGSGYTNYLVEGKDYCLDTNFDIEITVTQRD